MWCKNEKEALTESVSVCVRITEQTSLEHFIGRWLNAWKYEYEVNRKIIIWKVAIKVTLLIKQFC